VLCTGRQAVVAMQAVSSTLGTYWTPTLPARRGSIPAAGCFSPRRPIDGGSAKSPFNVDTYKTGTGSGHHHRVVTVTAKGFNSDRDALDLGQTLGCIKRKEGLLNLPPGKVGLFGIRETFEYLKDPNQFIKARVLKYGPVFKTGFFFKPAVVFGSREAVEEFREFETSLPADAALPETFRTLHTKYGALAQSGEEHVATRANFSKVLGRSALEYYTPKLATMTKEFVLGELLVGGLGTSGGMRGGKDETKDKTHEPPSSELKPSKLQPGYDLRQFCLKSLFVLFLGVVPPEPLMNEMYAYNEGLLALGKLSPEFEDGQKALGKLTEFVEKHYRTVKAQGKLDEEHNFFLKQYSTATDEFDTPFTDERIATTVVLMIWGAYIEAAANMGHALWTLMRNPEKLETLKKEVRVVFHKIRHTRFAPTRPAKGRVTGCRCSRVITHKHYERPEYKAACSLCINRPTQ